MTMPSSHLNHQVKQWCGVENGKKLIGLYKEIISMNNGIKFLNIERTTYPLTIFEDRFGLRASDIFRLR